VNGFSSLGQTQAVTHHGSVAKYFGFDGFFSIFAKLIDVRRAHRSVRGLMALRRLPEACSGNFGSGRMHWLAQQNGNKPASSQAEASFRRALELEPNRRKR
jgi:hypothetical protein